MPLPLENSERRKRRDPEILVWDLLIRVGHWLLALSFGALYLEYRKFPLHPYAGYIVLAVILIRIVWGFKSRGAARFSSFWFTPRQIFDYLKSAFKGHAEYYFSHNPGGAAMVYALLATLLLNTILGMLAYSASQQLGPFGKLVPDTWEDTLIIAHAWLGHLTALLVIGHLSGVLWASWLHRENYVLAMLSGIRRIPRAIPVPPGAVHPVVRARTGSGLEKLMTWLTYRRPFVGALLLMALIIGVLALPLIELLTRLNKILPAY